MDARPLSQLAQYWWDWGPWLDYYMPMVYVPDNPAIERTSREYKKVLAATERGRYLPALAPPGAKGGSNLLRLRQIDIAREYGAGVCYFWYHGLSDSYLDLLAKGPFRNR
jgi:hypothetical protein